MPDETPDNGAPSAFVFPARPQDATVRLAIVVEAGEDDSLRFSAILTPGALALDSESIEGIFRNARTVPSVGTYVLETNTAGTTVVSTPDGVNQDEHHALAFTMSLDLTAIRGSLVEALRVFPSQETINQAARQIVDNITAGSLERSTLEVKSVVDARYVEVEGVSCVHCRFRMGALDEFLSRLLGVVDGDGTTKVDNLMFFVQARDDRPVVMVGYLSHDNNFARFLNGILADCVRAEIKAVAVEVITEVAAKAENVRRMGANIIARVATTYNIDPAAIATRADALEAEARAELAKPPEEEDGDGTDDEESGDGLGNPAEEESAPPPAG